MPHTITVCAHNRPDYLRTVLVSLLTAMSECPELSREAQIVIGIDPGGACQEEVTEAVLQFADVVRLSGRRAPEVVVWPDYLGVSEHPRRLLQYVFMELRSDFNVHLEDDTVLSPDALRLAWWYRQLTVTHSSAQLSLDGILCLSLHSRSVDTTKPEWVGRRPDFGVWGWCCTHLAWWLWFSHYWNSKRYGKLGWDWSVSHMMQKHGLWALSPALSRVRNIGRERGTHQTPGGFDEEMQGLVCAGMEQMVKAEDFIIDSGKPTRPTWEWGD